jgi:hypothetical protein
MLAFTIFGTGGIVAILILVLIIAAVVYVVRRVV